MGADLQREDREGVMKGRALGYEGSERRCRVYVWELTAWKLAYLRVPPHSKHCSINTENIDSHTEQNHADLFTV